jgi:Glycosyltransferase Family 4
VNAGLRVLCLTNMWPGPADPDFGAFVADMCGALEARGMTVDPVVIDRRGGGPARTPAKYASLASRAARRARKADVVYAHFLFPTVAAAAAAARAARIPFVITAHGQDVRNL